MVPHVSNNAPRALLRACCARATCSTAQAHTRPLQPGGRGPRQIIITRPFSSHAPALTTARALLPTRPRWLEANAAPSSRTRRSYATSSSPGLPGDIAVLGGGLTGLATAYYLTRFHPHANITIYESQHRVGGWIDTEQAEVTTLAGTDETISFERGARVVSPQSTLTRYEDFVLYDLVWRPLRPSVNSLCRKLMLTGVSDHRTQAGGRVGRSGQGRPCA